jgi:hypothetical protein
LSANGFSEAAVRQMASEHARRLLDV